MHHVQNTPSMKKRYRNASTPSRDIRRAIARACMLPVDSLPLFAWQESRLSDPWGNHADNSYAVAKFAQRFRMSRELTQTVTELANVGGRGQ